MDLLDGKPIVVLIDDELIANRKTNRLYVHGVTLTKKTPNGCCGFHCSSWR